MVASTPGGAAFEYDLVHGYLFFQCIPGLGDEGDRVEIRRGEALP
jgi:hypothetical protein